ncbi:MAG: toxin-activating lysine-acyltransferase [Pseudomonadota bacterium]
MEKRIIETGGEFPSKDQLAGLGDLAFVFVRAPSYQGVTVSALRAALEPAIDTGHFAVLRQDHIPRAFISWAYLDEEAEARFLNGARLTTQDWISGDSLWLMDVVAPYGQGSAARMIKAFHAAIPETIDQYNTVRRAREPGKARRYVMTRLANGRWGSRMTGLIDADNSIQS